VAYASSETGDLEVSVRRFPGPGGKWRVSIGGGQSSAWSAKEHRLFYAAPGGLMVVEYSTDGENFVAGKPRWWARHAGINSFAVTPDGKRVAILENEPPARAETPHVVFLFGFFDELRRRVPPGRSWSFTPAGPREAIRPRQCARSLDLS
jgi:hypothetical protein